MDVHKNRLASGAKDCQVKGESKMLQAFQEVSPSPCAARGIAQRLSVGRHPIDLAFLPSIRVSLDPGTQQLFVEC